MEDPNQGMQSCKVRIHYFYEKKLGFTWFSIKCTIRSSNLEFYDTVLSEQGFYTEGGDNHIYNLTQLSMLQSLNHQWPSSGLRYETHKMTTNIVHLRSNSTIFPFS